MISGKTLPGRVTWRQGTLMLTQHGLGNAHSGTCRARAEEPQGMVHGAHSSATQQNQQIHPSSNIHQPSQGVSTFTATSQKEEYPPKGTPACWYFAHYSYRCWHSKQDGSWLESYPQHQYNSSFTTAHPTHNTRSLLM